MGRFAGCGSSCNCDRGGINGTAGAMVGEEDAGAGAVSGGVGAGGADSGVVAAVGEGVSFHGGIGEGARGGNTVKTGPAL